MTSRSSLGLRPDPALRQRSFLDEDEDEDEFATLLSTIVIYFGDER